MSFLADEELIVWWENEKMKPTLVHKAMVNRIVEQLKSQARDLRTINEGLVAFRLEAMAGALLLKYDNQRTYQTSK